MYAYPIKNQAEHEVQEKTVQDESTSAEIENTFSWIDSTQTAILSLLAVVVGAGLAEGGRTASLLSFLAWLFCALLSRFFGLVPSLSSLLFVALSSGLQRLDLLFFRRAVRDGSVGGSRADSPVPSPGGSRADSPVPSPGGSGEVSATAG